MAADTGLTFAEVEAFVVAHRLDPPTRLRCHPSVVNALRDTAPVPDWLTPLPPPGLPQIEVVEDHDLPFGAWVLYRGDEVISRSEAP